MLGELIPTPFRAAGWLRGSSRDNQGRNAAVDLVAGEKVDVGQWLLFQYRT